MKWKFQFEDADVRTLMRLLDDAVHRAESTSPSAYGIDVLCRRESVAQWKRIHADLYAVVGEP